MLIIKDFFNKLYIKFSKSKFVKWLFPIFIFCLVPNVLADSIILDNSYNNYFAINQSTSFPRKYTWSGSSSGNLTLEVATNELGYSYVILLICSNNNSDGTTFSISNSSYTNSYFVDGVAPVYDSGVTCKTGSNNNVDGSYKYIQLSVGKYEIQPSTGFNQYVASYLHYQNNKTWNQYITFVNGMLSDTDLISDKIQAQKSQAEILSSLSTLNSTISSQTNSINNNIDSESTAIQNKIDSQTNSLNNNIDDEFNKLKNQDHSYNQNASDNVPDSNNITSVTTAESDLLDRVNLDASSIDVTMSANTTNFIWDIVTNLRATNGKITLLFTSILSLAIIKMVLNR